MRGRLAVVGGAALVLWLADSGGAYWLNGQRWTSNIVMYLQLGSSGTLIDGSSSWGASAEGAMARWNQYLSGVEFRVVRDSTAAIGGSNGVNNVFGTTTSTATRSATRWRTPCGGTVVTH